MRTTKSRDNKTAVIVKTVADKHRVSTDYVYKIIRGVRENEEILADYMAIKESLNETLANALLEEVKKLVPFN